MANYFGHVPAISTQILMVYKAKLVYFWWPQPLWSFVIFSVTPTPPPKENCIIFEYSLICAESFFIIYKDDWRVPLYRVGPLSRPLRLFMGSLVAILDFSGGEWVLPSPRGWYSKSYATKSSSEAKVQVKLTTFHLLPPHPQHDIKGPAHPMSDRVNALWKFLDTGSLVSIPAY